MEQFSIPGAGGIIVREINGEDNILMQTRVKPEALYEDGLIEIPAGKIRAFESIFDTLRREVKEETGLDITEIQGSLCLFVRQKERCFLFQMSQKITNGHLFL